MEIKETYQAPKCILHLVQTSTAVAYSPNAIDAVSNTSGSWGDEDEMY